MKAAVVAASLPDEILNAESARRNGRRQTPHAGPGRPPLARCPGCEEQMTTTELRTHRLPCVSKRLEQIQNQGLRVRLQPKDPDPHPDFLIEEVRDTEVRFHKLSSDHRLMVQMQKIAEITVDGQERLVHIRLLGRVSWIDDIRIPTWRFTPSRIGRPKISKP